MLQFYFLSVFFNLIAGFVLVNDQRNFIELPLLKEKYRRASNTSEKDGAGLGLYLANYFMEKMDGKLGLRNIDPGFEVALYLRLV